MGGTNVPRGEARREAILRATLELIGERGPDSVTHRAVAERAGLPLSATTYWFASKEALLRETMVRAARDEVARIERVVLDLAPREFDLDEWAGAVAAVLGGDLEREPGRHLALFELGLEAARHPALRPEMARWNEAHLRLAEVGVRAAGSDDPARDAQVVVATLTGLALAQLVDPVEDFEGTVLRPAIEHLFRRLVAAGAVLPEVAQT